MADETRRCRGAPGAEPHDAPVSMFRLGPAGSNRHRCRACEALDMRARRAAKRAAPAPAAPSAPPPATEPPPSPYEPRVAIPEAHRAQPRPTELRRRIILPDAHIPFHDRLAWSVVLGILREWLPHEGVILGDWIDLASLSFHPKSKPDLQRLRDEYHAGNVALDQVQAATPDTSWAFLEGNHEARATKYANEIGELDGLLTVPEQLYLTPPADGYHRAQPLLRGMRWVPLSAQPYIASDSAFFHGLGFESMHFAAMIAAMYVPSKARGLPTFSGHMHSFAHATAKGFPGAFAQSCGWLGDETAHVFGYAQKRGRPLGWEHGVVLQTITPDGLMSYEVVRIRRGRALFGGTVVAREEANP